MQKREASCTCLLVRPLFLKLLSLQPCQGLAQFGNGFLSKFEAATCENRLLEEVSLVDTPGVLSGEKQRIERSYDFIQVCGWFAARCDLILLLFDPYKLDISDEFKEVREDACCWGVCIVERVLNQIPPSPPLLLPQVISTLRGHDDKVRVVLNKADTVDQQQLMRVYGALMWSLGKVFRAPEVCRVYIGSFNAGHPIREDVNPLGRALFEKEQEDLLHDLYEIPARSCDRKVNEFVKRVRAARIHCIILGHLRKQMPYFGQKKAQEKLLDNLAAEFQQIQREYHLHAGEAACRFREGVNGACVRKLTLRLRKGYASLRVQRTLAKPPHTHFFSPVTTQATFRTSIGIGTFSAPLTSPSSQNWTRA